MNGVWISRESWERLWNAMHNVQIRFSRLLSHPSGGITGDGRSAQFRIDLPERYQEPPREWCYELTDLGNDTWRINFYSNPDKGTAGTVRYRGSFYKISTSDCSFTVSKTDLSRDIMFILVKQASPAHETGVIFVPRLTHMTVLAAETTAEPFIGIARFAFSDQENRLFISVYHDRTIEWNNPLYQNDQLRMDLAFGPTPTSEEGFTEFLDGAVQYLLFDGHFCIMVNGFVIHQNGGGSTVYDMIAIDQYHQAGQTIMYVYWTCDISTGWNDAQTFNSVVNPRLEFRQSELTNMQRRYMRYRQVSIPLMSLYWDNYPVQCNAAQSGLYRITDYSPRNFPAYCINTFGLDFYPEVHDGWITIDISSKKLVIQTIRCYGNNRYLGDIPMQRISYENVLPESGKLLACCVFDRENDRWGDPYLMIGNHQVTADNSGVTGTVCSVEFAEIRGDDPQYASIRQNYGGPVRLFSYGDQISELKGDLATANSQIQDEIALLWSSIGTINARISSYHH